MKRIATITLMFAILISACDIIDEPYINQPINGDETGETVQKVLLEEFTGHKCPNCPEGAITAEQLHQTYGNKFVVIAYHTGFFARPTNDFPEDYRTEVGNDLESSFPIEGYPAGIINRTEFNGRLVNCNTAWPSATSEALNNVPRLQLKIDHTYTSNNVSVTINAKALCNIEPLKICVFITEDGLISAQETLEGVVENYEHKHVFRMSLNGTWGTQTFAEGAAVGQEETITVQGTIDANWNANNLNIVCFAYHSESGEIIQAEEKSL
ncbi:MAG: Omp28 family outer membrane lipoprotein [Bacteroidales bacterium]|nr:Omp28 family outer membrane lipoprotein [Bacteroidales bacterium]MDD4673526.1 Omp28 family outer membrane lipoprotein [Bacteroidales bacterium]MDY0348550.1 Omp28 family outer membrane lipoprotein [Tenuifilaceae bacterium]